MNNQIMIILEEDRDMKKCILLLLIIFSVLGLAGCSKDNGEQTTTGYAEFAVSETET